MKVILTSCRKGAMTISVTRLLRTESGMSLREAKAVVEEVLRGKEAEVTFPSEATAMRFLNEAERLGVCGRVTCGV